MVELMVVVGLIMVISAMAIIAYLPVLQDANNDTAMRQVLDQLRQGREYSLANRRYVQVTFPVVATGGGTQYQVVLTQRNDLTNGGGALNPILSTVPTHYPAQFFVFPGNADTPDAYGNTGSIVFEGVAGGPVGGMLFQSDGELVDGATYQPINGTVFLGVPGKPTTARAITVLGSTGRVRAWKWNGTAWFQF
jgi:type II secretory pathway pseudopilin PulG